MQPLKMLCAAALLHALAVAAAPCRSQAAAAAGASAAYQRDKAAAEELEKRTSASSDVLSKCLNSITTIQVVPTFPSLDSIFAGMVERVCKVTLDKVREGLPPTPPGWPVPAPPRLPASAQPFAQSSAAPAASPGQQSSPVQAPAAARQSGQPPDDFWKKIWR